MTNEPKVAWCLTHKCAATVYPDGSWSCWHELTCEYQSSDHVVDVLPIGARATVPYMTKVFGTRLRAWGRGGQADRGGPR